MIQVSEAGQAQPKLWHIWSRAWVLGFFGAEDVEKLNCWSIFKNLEVTQTEWEISGLSSEIISPDRISHILGWQQQGASWRPILGQALSSRGFPIIPTSPCCPFGGWVLVVIYHLILGLFETPWLLQQGYFMRMQSCTCISMEPESESQHCKVQGGKPPASNPITQCTRETVKKKDISDIGSATVK